MVCSCGSITFQLTSLHHRLPQLHQWLYKGPRVADCSESWENWRSHRKCELQKFNNHKCGSTTIRACSQAKNKLGTTSAADLVSHTSLQAQLDHHFLQLHSSDRRNLVIFCSKARDICRKRCSPSWPFSIEVGC